MRSQNGHFGKKLVGTSKNPKLKNAYFETLFFCVFSCFFQKQHESPLIGSLYGFHFLPITEKLSKKHPKKYFHFFTVFDQKITHAFFRKNAFFFSRFFAFGMGKGVKNFSKIGKKNVLFWRPKKTRFFSKKQGDMLWKIFCTFFWKTFFFQKTKKSI